jgi:hypothetical protein
MLRMLLFFFFRIFEDQDQRAAGAAHDTAIAVSVWRQELATTTTKGLCNRERWPSVSAD